MTAQQVSNAFQIEVEGSAMPAVDVTRVEVEDNLHLPDAFTLTIRDAARTALATTKLKIGAKVKISVLSDASPAPTKLLEGEVTALEAEFHGGTSFTMVRGYDQSHRLFRGRVTESYLNMTYADVAKKVAQRNQLEVGEIGSTSPTYAHISQSNESDWSFLSRLAAEVGFDVSVSQGKLLFKEPSESESAPGDRDLTSDNPLALMPGANLLFIRASVTAAEQVKEVEVRGWDPAEKKVVKATAAAKTDAVRNGSSSAAVAQAFPSPALVSTGLLLATDKAAEQAAKALADKVAASQTELEGEARGNAKLRAGSAVRISQLGDPFDGRYVLTTTRHTYDPDEGYVTWFVVSGRQQRSTLSLAGGGGAATGGSATVSGVVPAVVDDVDDPENLGRVRLRFPWLSDAYVSDWSRLSQVGAGKKRGLVVIPEVGDEVLVAFEQGDVRRPFVLGGLYNRSDEPELGPGALVDGSSKEINNRLFTSREGHQLLFVDAHDDKSVVIRTGDQKLTITLDQTGRTIKITSSGDIELKADGSIKIEAGRDLSLKGQSVSTEAQATWSGKGATATLEGSGPVSVKGQPIQLN